MKIPKLDRLPTSAQVQISKAKRIKDQIAATKRKRFIALMIEDHQEARRLKLAL
jgi:hypothetical protein